MSFNTAKIINVYYKADRKPYDANDKPISYFGEDFNGANEATEIRFYMPEGVDLGAVDCVAEVKRANGDKRFDLLTKITNGSGTYYRLVTNAWYNQYVGKVTIAFKAYFGGVTIVDGVITATSGAIYVSDIFHLQIAYAPSSTEPVPPFDPTDVTTFINALSAKLNVNNGIFVIASALPSLAGGVYDGQWFLVKNNTDGEQGRLYYIDGSTAIAVELELGKLKLTPTGNGDLTTNTGKLNWEQPNGTVQLGLYNNVNVGLGEDVFYYGKASANITKGQAIQFAGYQGDHLLIKPAVPSEINANPKLMMGIAKHDITSGDFGYVLHFGKLDGVDTGSFVAGNLLWFASGSGNNGELTVTTPNAPNAKILMCAVIKAETSGPANNGVIQVRITIEPRLTDLQDVEASDAVDKYVLHYDGLAGRWEATARLTTAETDIDSLEGRMTTAEADIDSLEGRMDTAEGDIDDIEDGTTVVPKALGDQNGDTINTTYLKVATAVSTYIPLSQKGVPNGVAPLGSDNKILSIHLPGGVDDVKEFANLASFPATGEASIIYVALDTNKTYRWGGSEYVVISETLALGETSSTAFPGNRGVALETSVADIIDGDQALSLKDQVIRNSAVGTIPLTINGVASTTANLTEFQVDGAKKLEITKDGFLTQNGTVLLHTTGTDNVFLGSGVANLTLTGGQNSALGFQALQNNTTASSSVAIGMRSLRNSTTGGSNVALGRESGLSNTTGSANVFIGRDAGNNASQLANASNSTAIGYQAYTDKSNQMVFGNASVTEFVFNRNTGALVLMPQIEATYASGTVGKFTRTSAVTSINTSTPIRAKHKTSGDMIDGFGASMAFLIEDSANVENEIAYFGASRSGADNSGRFIFQTSNAGTSTEKMTIMPDGKVGIGTSAPASLLSVVTSSNADGIQIRRNSTTNNDYATLGFRISTADNAQSFAEIRGVRTNRANALDTDISFHTTSASILNERMRIRDDGNVGIGTSSPATKLHVAGAGSQEIRIENTNTTIGLNDIIGTLSFRSNDASSGGTGIAGSISSISEASSGVLYGLAFNTKNFASETEKMRITNDGKVGIGTTAPETTLSILAPTNDDGIQIRRNSTSNNASASIGFRIATSESIRSFAELKGIRTNRVTAGDTDLVILTSTGGNSPTEKMRIRDDGLVGINETSPTAQLQVKSGATTRVPLIVDTLNAHDTNLQEWRVNTSQVSRMNLDGRFATTTGMGNSTTSNNAYVNVSTNGTIISRNVADTNPALIVNLANSSATGNIQVWQKAGSAVSAVDKDGLVRTAGIYSINVGFNNGNMTFGSNGPVIRRNIADSNPALIVDLQNSSSTGNILVLQNAGSAVASFSNSGIFVGQSRPANDAKTANHTLTFVDEGRVLRINSSSDLTVTIPLNSGTELPVGFEVALIRYGTGAVTISPTSGVTLNSKNSERKISGQYASVALKKIGSDEWVLVGSLEA